MQLAGVTSCSSVLRVVQRARRLTFGGVVVGFVTVNLCVSATRTGKRACLCVRVYVHIELKH